MKTWLGAILKYMGLILLMQPMTAYLIKLFIIWRLPWPNPLYSYHLPTACCCTCQENAKPPLGFLHVEVIRQSLRCGLRYYNVCLFSHFSLSAPLSSEPTVPSVQTVSGVLEDKATNASTANCWCTKSATNWSQWSVADQFTKWVAELWTVSTWMKNVFEGFDLLVNHSVCLGTNHIWNAIESLGLNRTAR